MYIQVNSIYLLIWTRPYLRSMYFYSPTEFGTSNFIYYKILVEIEVHILVNYIIIKLLYVNIKVFAYAMTKVIPKFNIYESTQTEFLQTKFQIPNKLKIEVQSPSIYSQSRETKFK